MAKDTELPNVFGPVVGDMRIQVKRYLGRFVATVEEYTSLTTKWGYGDGFAWFISTNHDDFTLLEFRSRSVVRTYRKAEKALKSLQTRRHNARLIDTFNVGGTYTENYW